MRQELEKATQELIGLLRSGMEREDAYQTFFEEHPIVFKILGYEEAYPKIKLPLDENEYLEPDFILTRPNGLFEILDIKTPQEELVKTKKYRNDLYAKVSEYLSQVEHYSEYFDDDRHRELVRTNYGFDIQKRPDTLIMIGTDQDLDKKILHNLLRRRSRGVRISTYDDVITSLLFYHANLYGHSENLKGASVHALLQIRPKSNACRQYIFDSGETLNRNRWSIFIDEKRRLCFEVYDSNGKNHLVAVDEGESSLKYDDFFYLCCEFGSSDNFSIMQILVNNVIRSRAESTEPIPLPAHLDLKNSIIGTDLTKTCFAAFTITELIIYNRVLSFPERLDHANHFFERFLKNMNKTDMKDTS
jgi:hypothetical protein